MLPSGSAKEISELPQAPPPIFYELLADTASCGSPMRHKHGASIASSAKSKTAIYVSTRILTQSRTSIERSNNPRVETTITSGSSPKPKSSSRPESLNLKRSSPLPRALPSDLMRPLPPTPISESPQVSPVTPHSQRSRRGRLRRGPVTAPPNSVTISGTFEHVSPTSLEDETSELLIGRELVIPPGGSEPDVSSLSSTEREEGRKPDDSFSWI